MSVIHACPPLAEGAMPCCGRTPFEVPVLDRISSDPSLVTCVRKSTVSAEVIEEAVRVILAHTYTTEGVEIWMTGANRRLDGAVPLDLIRDGEGERVLTVALIVGVS